MGMQMEHVRLFGTGVHVAKTNRVSDIGVMDIRGVVRIQGLDNFVVVVTFDHHGRVAVCPGRQEKFFQLAFRTISCRSEPLARALAALIKLETLAIREHHGTHATGAVVNAHAVAHGPVGRGLVVQFGKCLRDRQFIMKDSGEFSIGFPARVPFTHTVTKHRAFSGCIDIDNCIEIGIDKFLPVAVVFKHIENGLVLARVIRRVLGLVVDEWLTVCRSYRLALCILLGCQLHIVFGHLRAVKFRPFGRDVDRTEQTEAQLPAVTFAAGSGSHGIE